MAGKSDESKDRVEGESDLIGFVQVRILDNTVIYLLFQTLTSNATNHKRRVVVGKGRGQNQGQWMAVVSRKDDLVFQAWAGRFAPW